MSPWRVARTRQPWLLEDFEYLAARAKRWLALHPAGDYPKATPHLQIQDSWVAGATQKDSD